jgi:hypothetical protein
LIIIISLLFCFFIISFFVLLRAIARTFLFKKDKFLRFFFLLFIILFKPNFPCCRRIKRWLRPPPQSAPPPDLTYPSLFIRKFEVILSLKGSPSLRSGQARQAPLPACRACPSFGGPSLTALRTRKKLARKDKIPKYFVSKKKRKKF